MYRILACIVLFVFLAKPGKLQAQTTDLKQIVAPSPSSAALGQFGNVPIGLYTGSAQVSIPLYEIKEGSLTLPLSLSYNTGGSKVADMASWVGLGFSLNAGGCISRTVYGLPDENRRTNPSFILPDFLSPGQAKEELMAANVDYQPDVFYFNFNGKSGKFVLSNSTTIGISPHQNLKIQAYDGGGAPIDPPFYQIPSLMFRITDENGIVYEFKDIETNRTLGFDPDKNQSPDVLGPTVPPASKTAWYLTDMYSPTGDTIRFVYNTYELIYDLPSSEQQFNQVGQHGEIGHVAPVQARYVKNAVRSKNVNKRLQQILFSNGSVSLVARQPRWDLIGDTTLNQLMVYRKDGTLLKGYSLNYKYSVAGAFGLEVDTVAPPSSESNYYADWVFGISGASNHHLLLTRISELDNTAAPNGKNYSFDYELSSGGLPSRFSKRRDFWGYYNGNSDDETSFLNYQLVGSGLVPSSYVIAGKEPDSNYCRQDMLTRITYPTGGSTQLNYEMHNAYVGRGVLPPDVIPQTFSMPINFLDYSTPGAGFVDTTINGLACYYKTFTFNAVGVGGYANVKIANMLSQGPKPVMKFDIYDSNNQPYLLMLDLENNELTQTTSVTVNPTTQVFTYTLNNYYFSNGTYKVIFTPITSFIGNSNYLNTYLAQPTFTINGWSNVLVHTDTVDISRNIGGLRIRSTLDYDPVTNKYLEKDYNYNLVNSSLSSGELVAGLSYIYQLTEYLISAEGSPDTEPFNVQANFDYIVLNGESNYALSTTQGSNVGYSVVTVTETDPTTGTPNGKSEYHFSSPKNFPDYYGSTPGPINNFPYPPADSRDWQRGLQLRRIDYKYVNGQYQALKRETNIYGSPVYVDSQTGFVARYKDEVIPTVADTSAELNGPAGPYGNPESFMVARYQLTSGYVPLLTKTITQIENGDSITEAINYVYGDAPSNMLPTSISSTDSKGNISTTHLTYPFDYSVTNPLTFQGQGILDLQQHHILSPVVEKYVQKSTGGGTDIGVISGVYTSFKPSQPLPDTIFRLETPVPVQSYTPVAIGNAGTNLNTYYKPFISFGAYDNFGNILQQGKVGDITQVYIWDYNAKYPVAAVQNAQSGDIAYTSFEADGAGNWTIGNGTLNQSAGITGHNSYSLSGSLSKSGLNAGTTYLVSYWTQGGPMNVSGTLSGYPRKGKTVLIANTNWTLYTHKVTGEATITVSGTGTIDELRLYPATAQMSTYTYDPLVGMTSQTDIANRTTYYEYDGLARLKRVRDQDYNILKSLDYQYQTPGGCGSGCLLLSMQTFAGSATISYPVGVFGIHGSLLGNAANADDFVSKWNSDTADSRIGTLAKGADSMHFNLALNSGQTPPGGVTGCRYYQWDLPWNILDGIMGNTGAYVDFGDGTGMHIPKTGDSTTVVFAPNTTFPFGYTVHTYADTSLKTITIYHDDGNENLGLDNASFPAISLSKIRHLRGYFPQRATWGKFSSMQQASALSFDSIYNWNSITTISSLQIFSGDGGTTPCTNVSYAQDFMAGNRGLQSIVTSGLGYHQNGIRDTTFKLSRLKSNWNTYFTNLQVIGISDDHWNREDLSALTKLTVFALAATTIGHTNDLNSLPVPIPASVVDNILIQIAAGAGQNVSNGIIYINAVGPRSSASNAAVNFLLSKGWTITISGHIQTIQ